MLMSKAPLSYHRKTAGSSFGFLSTHIIFTDIYKNMHLFVYRVSPAVQQLDFFVAHPVFHERCTKND